MEKEELLILILSLFPSFILCTHCFAPEFKTEGEFNLAQTLEPCCYGSSKCNTSSGQFNFGQNFRLSTVKPDVILSCVTPGVFHCTRCPGGLYFSEKCNACMEFLNDDRNACIKPPASLPTENPASYDKEFCKKNPLNGKYMGNVKDPENNHYYYACVNEYTYHMPCPKGLSYKEKLDSCQF